MKQLIETLEVIRANLKTGPALMTHVVLGYPTLRESMDLVCAMADAGAALIELQIPFSDPIADGPTIMRASEAALENNVTPKHCMRAMERLSSRVTVPLLFMSYLNILLSYKQGIRSFCRDAANAGAQGLIVPDDPPEEGRIEYWNTARALNLAPIPLVAPTTTAARIKKIRACSSRESFVYCVSTTGTTGARAALPAGLKEYLKRTRKAFKMPLAVGFGISKPEHTRALRGHAEIAVVGSAVIDLITNTSGSKRTRAVQSFLKRLTN